MATIAEMLNCAYMFEDPDEMPEGLSGMLPEYISNGLGDGQPAQIWAGEWSMSAYKASLEQRKKENGDGIVLDELEKSIVAQIADEVTVGIHGRKVRLVISKAC